MDAPYSSTDKFPRVPLKIAGAKPLQFSHNPNYGCPQFPGVPLKIAGAKPQQFSHNPNYGCPLWMPLMDAPCG